ncbi:thiamine phosphate synthase [bacterium 210820-DFI.6.37]|nr:thiamine phosphate synthase [bacterium 210820-DFI.6.37]
MCTFKRIAISNRRLCPIPLTEQAAKLSGQADILILREKDLTEDAYERLARQVQAACRSAGIKLICHSFPRVARRIGCGAIHLTLADFLRQQEDLEDFETIGVSIHSREEALQVEAVFQARGLTGYITASNIFETSCKAGLAGKGTRFLEELCREVSIPVYGLGGITAENEALIRKAGAAGACRMSDYMR